MPFDPSACPRTRPLAHAPARSSSSCSPTSPYTVVARRLHLYAGRWPCALVVGERVVLRVAVSCLHTQLARSYTSALTFANTLVVRSSAASARRALILPSVHRARLHAGRLWSCPHVPDPKPCRSWDVGLRGIAREGEGRLEGDSESVRRSRPRFPESGFTALAAVVRVILHIVMPCT